MLDFTTATNAQLITLYYLFCNEPLMRKKYNLDDHLEKIGFNYLEKDYLEKELTALYVALENEFLERGLL